MIPILLNISGFLSYRQPVEINFTTFDLACIAGQNGAGKSSLLDAITWVLFGAARKRDDSVIHVNANLARVNLIFAYESNIYHVQRSKPRDKTALLEFHILQDQDLIRQMLVILGRDLTARAIFPSTHALSEALAAARWKPLTEHSLKATEAQIQSVLRMDYETFINASFFLQGKADQFTQQKPSDRKRILSSILGLEIWEHYKDVTAQRRRTVEIEMVDLDGQLKEVLRELAEEDERRHTLAVLKDELKIKEQQSQTQQSLVDNARRLDSVLKEQQRSVDDLARQLGVTQTRATNLAQQLALRSAEQAQLQALLAQSEQIKAAYAAWQADRAALETWDALGRQFNQAERERSLPLAAIQAERAALESERRSLLAQQKEIESVLADLERQRPRLAQAEKTQAELEAPFLERQTLQQALEQAQARLVAARTGIPRLEESLHEAGNYIKALQSAQAACPMCGQNMGEAERMALIARMSTQSDELTARLSAQQAALKQDEVQENELRARLDKLSRGEAGLRRQNELVAEIKTRLQHLEASALAWQSGGALRLAEVERLLAEESFALPERARLAEIDAVWQALGYDAEAHEALRLQEQAGRASDAAMRQLENSQSALAPLSRAVSDLEQQSSQAQQEADELQDQHARRSAALAEMLEQTPNLATAEGMLYQLLEDTRGLQNKVGAAEQRVSVLATARSRKAQFEEQRQVLARLAQQYKQLERAFGKDGVPALLIETALPDIEARANSILQRLTGGSMSVSFVTQAAYKDKARDDLRETLDIRISDGVGIRDYEMFSGGEAFRVNFAVRLALSEVLAQRSGARLQTLVVDEGFGSQDSEGRSRLIEAINMVRPDFHKILVITHIEELKDAFPTRIEITKTDDGSQVRVI